MNELFLRDFLEDSSDLINLEFGYLKYFILWLWILIVEKVGLFLLWD